MEFGQIFPGCIPVRLRRIGLLNCSQRKLNNLLWKLRSIGRKRNFQSGMHLRNLQRDHNLASRCTLQFQWLTKQLASAVISRKLYPHKSLTRSDINSRKTFPWSRSIIWVICISNFWPYWVVMHASCCENTTLKDWKLISR